MFVDYFDVVKDLYPDWQKVSCDDVEDCLKAVSSGRADCFLISSYRYNSIRKLCEKYKLTSLDTGKDIPFCIAVKGGETALYSILAKTTNLIADSYVNNMLTHYFAEEGKTTFGDMLRENIIIALQSKRGILHKISKKEADEIAERLIKELAIKTPSADQKIKNLSGGNQQKVLLARWLATNPKLLILDEPARGIDIGVKAEIQKTVVGLVEQGMSCVFISSELEEMERCCTKMFILRDKKIVGELGGDEISQSAIMKRIAGEGNT